LPWRWGRLEDSSDSSKTSPEIARAGSCMIQFTVIVHWTCGRKYSIRQFQCQWRPPVSSS
jgi:hypothetical protein